MADHMSIFMIWTETHYSVTDVGNAQHYSVKLKPTLRMTQRAHQYEEELVGSRQHYGITAPLLVSILSCLQSFW